MDVTQREQIASGRGFFAALDQSGGSTPKALSLYGIKPESYSGDQQMFDLMGASDKTMHMVDGDHYFHHEGSRDDVADLVTTWVKERV